VVESPFSGGPVSEIHLSNAPLVHVVAQVRFPKILNIADQGSIAQLHSALKAMYPVLHSDKAVGLVITTAEGVTAAPPGVVWRMQSKSGDWQVTVADTFVALDTASYTSRADFVERLGAVLTAVANVFEPAIAERVGIRYIDRVIENGDFARLATLVRREALGGLEIPRAEGVELVHSLSENLFNVHDDQVMARWGVLPAGAVLDPVMPPVPSRSWILDIDVSRSGRLDFVADDLTSTSEGLAARAYQFFRWVASDALLRESGGSL
jgi:uncharacterized protein (TIGR04255 family)